MKSHTRHLVLLDGRNEWFVVVHALHVRAFITFVICQICKCLNNDLLWGTSWRLQAAKLQWKPQLWDLWSGWGAVCCTLFVDGWTILVCWKVFEGFLKVFEGCKQQSYKIFEAVEEQFIAHFLWTLGQYCFFEAGRRWLCVWAAPDVKLGCSRREAGTGRLQAQVWLRQNSFPPFLLLS